MAVLNPPPCRRCRVGVFATGVLRPQPLAAGSDGTGKMETRLRIVDRGRKYRQSGQDAGRGKL
uniref:Uncharacterized protein n=1 Tax=Hyaloperonospora arabidopsidis (strain Emoy2) TaxID=559515 RepID=M4BRG4_HYAAE